MLVYKRVIESNLLIILYTTIMLGEFMSDQLINNKTIFDYPAIKIKDSNRKLKTLLSSEALENAMLIWMTSSQGDYIRAPLKGGYILPYLCKTMTDERGNDIADAIFSGLKDDFEVALFIEEIRVVPDYKNRIWEITIKGYSPDIKDNFDLQTRLRNQI